MDLNLDSSHCPGRDNFKPVMDLSETAECAEVIAAQDSRFVDLAKLFPIERSQTYGDRQKPETMRLI